MARKNSIEVQGLYKKYPIGLIKKKEALKGVSFQVAEGEVFGIVGRNGAGKSTLIKAITGLLRPNSGTILVDGFLPSDPRSRRSIGYLPESPCLYQNLTVRDHFFFIARVHGLEKASLSGLGDELLSKVRLLDAGSIPIRKFSKGMMQRAALACALLPDPQILILDEPMSGLDPIGRQLVVDLIREYHERGKTILFCSHILTDVERICDRIGIMDAGELKAVVSFDDLAGSEGAEAAPKGATPLEAFFLNLVAQEQG